CALRVAGPARDRAEPGECPGAVTRLRVALDERGLEPFASLGETGVEVEEPAERAREREKPRRVRHEKVQRGPKVVQFLLEHVRPACFRLEPSGIRALGEVEEARGMPIANLI